jgi:hypothetical protein
MSRVNLVKALIEQEGKCTCGRGVGFPCEIHRKYTAEQYDKLTTALATKTAELESANLLVKTYREAAIDYDKAEARIAELEGERDDAVGLNRYNAPRIKILKEDRTRLREGLETAQKLHGTEWDFCRRCYLVITEGNEGNGLHEILGEIVCDSCIEASGKEADDFRQAIAKGAGKNI